MSAARVRVVNDSWKFVKVSYDNMEDHTLRHDMQHPFAESSMVVIKMPVESPFSDPGEDWYLYGFRGKTGRWKITITAWGEIKVSEDWGINLCDRLVELSESIY